MVINGVLGNTSDIFVMLLFLIIIYKKNCKTLKNFGALIFDFLSFISFAQQKHDLYAIKYKLLKLLV